MNYQDTLHYLYNALPMFQRIGSLAYKEGLDNSFAFDNLLDHPHRQFRSIHIGGTNGKGSTSHLLSAILQSEGYKVGLYTSPHLLDFRERIRINGKPISEKKVIDFVAVYRAFFEEQHLSFFEMTTGLAFHCFAEEKVDYAIIEVGLGGRLDCTNIIYPALSVITNISFDHVQLLGNTLEKIAIEKAGIIKAHTPVVIGEKRGVEKVFIRKAMEVNAPIFFAEEIQPITNAANNSTSWDFEWEGRSRLKTPLGGYAQEHNANTVLTAIDVLRNTGHAISDNAVEKGFNEVLRLTGLRGRWEKLQDSPAVICDTGHNTGGIEYIVKQLKAYPHRQLRIIFGMVNDKEIDSVLELLPTDALYYFTQASVERALNCSELQTKALKKGLKGKCYPSVSTAIATAIQESSEEDMIFIGGSTFIVADALQFYERERTAS